MRDPNSRTDPRQLLPIAVFVGSWLPYSETFVYDQLQQMRRLSPWVIAGSKTPYASRFPFDNLSLLSRLDQLRVRYWGRAPRVDRLVEQSGARLILAHFGPNGAYALPFARRQNLPLVVMFHGHGVGGLLPVNRNTVRYFRYQRLAPKLFQYADLLLCASEELRTTLIACGAPPSKLRVHRLGIDTQKFKPRADRERASVPTVLMVGRLVEKKGMAYGLLAFANVLKVCPAACLRIIGEGPLRRGLEQQADSLGVASATVFVGSLTPAQVIEEMGRAHVLLTPSVVTAQGDRESGVLVVKEAGALGLPTVGTQHGGIPEIIDDGQTGYLVPERDVGALSQRLLELLQDSRLAEEMGRAARNKIVAEYEQKTQVAEFEELLLSVVSRHAEPHSG